MKKETWKYLAIAGAVVGVGVGTLFAVKKLRALYEAKDTGGVNMAEVSFEKPTPIVKKKTRTSIPITMEIDDEE